MTSPARAAANAANAQLSTGPRTAAGRARSARNALKHGLTSQDLIVREDEQDDFHQFQQSLLDDLVPQGAIEMFTFNQLLRAAWNMERARRLETGLCANGIDPLLDESAARQLDRIQRHANQSERSYFRHLKELRLLQTNRLARIITLTDEELNDCPTLVSCGDIAKQTQQYRTAKAQAAAHAGQQVIARIEAETNACLAGIRASRMQNEPTAPAWKEETAARTAGSEARA